MEGEDFAHSPLLTHHTHPHLPTHTCSHTHAHTLPSLTLPIQLCYNLIRSVFIVYPGMTFSKSYLLLHSKHSFAQLSMYLSRIQPKLSVNCLNLILKTFLETKKLWINVIFWKKFLPKPVLTERTVITLGCPCTSILMILFAFFLS